MNRSDLSEATAVALRGSVDYQNILSFLTVFTNYFKEQYTSRFAIDFSARWLTANFLISKALYRKYRNLL
jgi:hypothetical protein